MTDSRENSRQYSDPNPRFGTAPGALLEGFTGASSCEVHVISCVQQPVCSPVKLAENIFYHSLVVPKMGWLRGAYLGCIRATRRKLREIRPDIVHGQGTERYCALSAVFSGFPNVITIHGNMRVVSEVHRARPFTFEWIAARLEGFTLPKTCGVFCNSRYTEELVRSCAKRTWLVPNALRARFFVPPTVVQPRSLPVLLNIGVIDPRKSQHEILKMADQLRRRQARFKLGFVGRLHQATSYGAQFKELIDRAQAIGHVDYLGERSETELIKLMDNADALIHAPSEEAFGLVAAEALARDLRLFGFKVGGLSDICNGVDGAELVDPNNFSALEESVFKWLSSGAPKASGGAERMLERYHPEVIARRHLAIYDEVLAGRLSALRSNIAA